MNEIPYKRIITVFSAIILMLCFFGGKEVHAQGQEGKQNTVRVGWYQSDMFQEGISDEQVKRGYCYDYLQKVSDMLSEEYDLGTVVEYRNFESGEHIKRVKGYTRIPAERLMKDSILMKPGKLSPNEYEYMKSHTLCGCEILEKIKDAWSKEYGRTI